MAVGCFADPSFPAPTKSVYGYRRRTVSMNAACLMDSMAINEALSDRRINFVFLKGPFQQHLLYDDHFMKPAGDVDILVAPA
ncbi:nucleotidyltransferase family protein, partial [Mesorhizobium sp. M1D.F.Ca.ET.234.01.1.1]|uniref:nucleotidyltransferase family protein n=1 Tax=Mesorhizobium sp. M1D.F.Ca.ET.234.01.1.1 TaxID=2563932 RepID=UPI001FDEB3EB